MLIVLRTDSCCLCVPVVDLCACRSAHQLLLCWWSETGSGNLVFCGAGVVFVSQVLCKPVTAVAVWFGFFTNLSQLSF